MHGLVHGHLEFQLANQLTQVRRQLCGVVASRDDNRRLALNQAAVPMFFEPRVRRLAVVFLDAGHHDIVDGQHTPVGGLELGDTRRQQRVRDIHLNQLLQLRLFGGQLTFHNLHRHDGGIQRGHQFVQCFRCGGGQRRVRGNFIEINVSQMCHVSSRKSKVVAT